MERLKDFFDLTRNEQRGILSLSVLVAVLLVARITTPLLKIASPDPGMEALSTRVNAQLDKNLERVKDLPVEETSGSGSHTSGFRLKNFDPNVASASQLCDLGFKEWQIKNIVNFRASGGVFYKKEDLKKLYAIKEKDYDKIAPYVVISPLQVSVEKQQRVGSPVTEVTPIELNTADTVALRKLKGVGAYFARKIVEYRTRLGGFTEVSQLQEIYNLDPEVIVANSTTVSIDRSLIRRININTVSRDELKKHPYIGFPNATAIINYRNQHGPYAAIKEISNSVLITDSVYSKIAPYLKVDD
ncbi:MAG: helix-hairpin-helix domain-containing protein [Bacteroidota bacterium]